MTKEETELLPCPLCGNSDLLIHETPSSDRTMTWYKLLHTATTDCGISMIDHDKENLIASWNRRHLTAEITRLKEALEKIANPFKYLEDEAKKSGSHINGFYAKMIMDDVNHWREIAKQALNK